MSYDAAVTKDLSPGSVAPLFGLLALLFAAAVLSRFDGFAGQVPPAVHGAALAASFPLLMLGATIERQIDYGRVLKGMPLWMQIDSRPVRWFFSLAMTYLGIVALQVFDLDLGLIDPSAPAEWPPQQRLGWFVMFSFGMSFASLLLASSALVPALRVITWPFARLPAGIGLPLAAVFGLGLGALALAGLTRADDVRAITGYVEALKQQPVIAVALTVVLLVVLPLFARIWQRK